MQKSAETFLLWNDIVGSHFESVMGKLNIQIGRSMCIYLKNNPDKFCADPIWNNVVMGFSEECRPDNKTSSDVRTGKYWLAEGK